jgi:hypothetical protein
MINYGFNFNFVSFSLFSVLCSNHRISLFLSLRLVIISNVSLYKFSQLKLVLNVNFGLV